MSDDFHSTPSGSVRDTYVAGNISHVESAFLRAGSQAWHGAFDREQAEAAARDKARGAAQTSYSGGRAEDYVGLVGAVIMLVGIGVFVLLAVSK